MPIIRKGHSQQICFMVRMLEDGSMYLQDGGLQIMNHDEMKKLIDGLNKFMKQTTSEEIADHNEEERKRLHEE